MTSKTSESYQHSILIVDDDEIFCEMIIASLVELGLRSLSANTLQDGICIVSKHQFDIVVIDNHLPDGSGAELLLSMQDLNSSSFVLMISADDEFSSIADSYALGVHDYLIKPVKLPNLVKKIHNLLSFKEAGIKLEQKNNLLNQLVAVKLQEESLAQHVYDNIASSLQNFPSFAQVKTRSFSNFSGDMLLLPDSSTGRIQILLADAMGHGLAAAICLIPIIATIRAMALKAKSLEEIFHEVNRKLYYEIPDDRFVAMLGLEICPYSSVVKIFNAGLPSVICGMQNGDLQLFKSRAMPLGIMAPHDFMIQPDKTPLETIRQIAIFTDGLNEQTNPEGEALTLGRIVAEAKQLHSQENSLISLMDYCIEHASGKSIEDDMTLCVINCDELITTFLQQPISTKIPFGHIEFKLTVKGLALSEVDCLGQAMSFLQASCISKELCQKAFTALAELVNNAIDHGILELDSKLKNDVDGFATYLSLREKRLTTLKESDQITVQISASSTTNITITVEDSGSGFDPEDSKYSLSELGGRGLGLLTALSHSIERNTLGNRTTIIIRKDQ